MSSGWQGWSMAVGTPLDDSCMTPLQVTAEASSVSCPSTLDLPRMPGPTKPNPDRDRDSGWPKGGHCCLLKGRVEFGGPGSCHLQVTTNRIY